MYIRYILYEFFTLMETCVNRLLFRATADFALGSLGFGVREKDQATEPLGCGVK